MVAVKIALIIFLVIFLLGTFLVVIACVGIAGRCSKAEREQELIQMLTQRDPVKPINSTEKGYFEEDSVCP